MHDEPASLLQASLELELDASRQLHVISNIGFGNSSGGGARGRDLEISDDHVRQAMASHSEFPVSRFWSVSCVSFWGDLARLVGIDGYFQGLTSGWMDRWMDKWESRQTDAWLDREREEARDEEMLALTIGHLSQGVRLIKRDSRK